MKEEEEESKGGQLVLKNIQDKVRKATAYHSVL
jgi:hypothetical protein